MSLRTIAASIVLALAVSACNATQSPNPPSQMPNAAPAVTTARVEMSYSKYRPSLLRISIGTLVKWTNEDGISHTATALDGSWTSNFLGKGGHYAHLFDKAGTYRYFCKVHSTMRGTIVVK